MMKLFGAGWLWRDKKTPIYKWFVVGGFRSFFVVVFGFSMLFLDTLKINFEGYLHQNNIILCLFLINNNNDNNYGHTIMCVCVNMAFQ